MSSDLANKAERAGDDRKERVLFAVLLIILPFQTRIALTAFGVGEWLGAWLWVSDVIVLTLFAFWMRRGIKLRDLFPLIFLVVFLPTLVVNPSGIAFWRFLKLVEGLFLVAYVKRHAHWLIEALARPKVFLLVLIGLFANALAGVAQFSIQHDLGLSRLLGESPIDPMGEGVAKFIVGGTKIIRAYGFTPHPNILGALLAVGIVLVGFLYIFRGMGRSGRYSLKRQREELIRGAALFVLVLGLLFTFSRVAWISAAVGLGTLLAVILIFRSLRRIYAWEVSRIAILFSSIVVILGVAFWPFLSSRIDFNLAAEQSFSLRSFYAQEAVEMIGENPITGVGLGGYVTELAAKNPEAPAWSIQPVHNVTLLLAAEAGFPAMAVLTTAFAVLVIGALRKLRETRDPSIALAQGLALSLAVVILLLSLGDHLLWTSQQGNLLLWIVIGLLA